jgi:hypothetical protein
MEEVEGAGFDAREELEGADGEAREEMDRSSAEVVDSTGGAGGELGKVAAGGPFQGWFNSWIDVSDSSDERLPIFNREV